MTTRIPPILRKEIAEIWRDPYTLVVALILPLVLLAAWLACRTVQRNAVALRQMRRALGQLPDRRVAVAITPQLTSEEIADDANTDTVADLGTNGGVFLSPRGIGAPSYPPLTATAKQFAQQWDLASQPAVKLTSSSNACREKLAEPPASGKRAVPSAYVAAVAAKTTPASTKTSGVRPSA